MFSLIRVWSETKHEFIGSGSTIELLKSRLPKEIQWKENAVGGFTGQDTETRALLVIKKYEAL